MAKHARLALAVALAILGSGCWLTTSGRTYRVTHADGDTCVQAFRYEWNQGDCARFTAEWGDPVATICGVSRIVEDPTCSVPEAPAKGGR